MFGQDHELTWPGSVSKKSGPPGSGGMGQPEFNKGRAPVELGQRQNQNRRGPAGHSEDFVVSEVIAMPAQMSQVDATQNDGRLVQLYASSNSHSLAWLESAFDVLRGPSRWTRSRPCATRPRPCASTRTTRKRAWLCRIGRPS